MEQQVETGWILNGEEQEEEEVVEGGGGGGGWVPAGLIIVSARC